MLQLIYTFFFEVYIPVLAIQKLILITRSYSYTLFSFESSMVVQTTTGSSKSHISVAEQALTAHSLKLVLQARALHTHIKHC
jgi:hypothetical protein